MRSIPTRYAGCHFRSRLEARWAVFLDTLDVEWQYEPEGFDMGGAGYYLPDFRIDLEGRGPGWLEVKPFGDHHHRLEDAIPADQLRKVSTFSIQPGVHIAVVGEFGRKDHGYVPAWQWEQGQWAPSLQTLDRGAPDIRAAWRAARSSRFEHGEEGPT